MPNTDQYGLNFNCNYSLKIKVFILVPHNSEKYIEVNMYLSLKLQIPILAACV